MIDPSKLQSIDESVLGILVEELRDVGFTEEFLTSLMGKVFVRYSWVPPFERALLLDHQLASQPLRELVSLLLFGGPARFETVAELAPNLLRTFLSAGLFQRGKDQIQSHIRLAPFFGRLFLTEAEGTGRADAVLPLAQEQAMLVMVGRRLLATSCASPEVLDICCGSGILGQSIATNVDSVVGLDINPRAINFSEFNGRLNTVSCRYHKIDIQDNFPANTFDIVVANPPYNALVSASAGVDDMALATYAGTFGNHIWDIILDKLDGLLNPGGIGLVVSKWLLKEGRVAGRAFDCLSDCGTVILVRTPRLAIGTWEGMRVIFDNVGSWEELPPGSLMALLKEANFDEVTFGVLVYLKGRKPCFYHVETARFDHAPVSAAALDEVQNLVER